MSLLKERTEELYSTIKTEIEDGQLTTIEQVATAIVRGAEVRSVVFKDLKEVAKFQIMGDIDSESLYQMVKQK